jgi:hypothetical protein
MELALQWLESQRAVMYDPTKAGWFLQYQPEGYPNGTIYNEARGEGDQVRRCRRGVVVGRSRLVGCMYRRRSAGPS